MVNQIKCRPIHNHQRRWELYNWIMRVEVSTFANSAGSNIMSEREYHAYWSTVDIPFARTVSLSSIIKTEWGAQYAGSLSSNLIALRGYHLTSTFSTKWLRRTRSWLTLTLSSAMRKTRLWFKDSVMSIMRGLNISTAPTTRPFSAENASNSTIQMMSALLLTCMKSKEWDSFRDRTSKRTWTSQRKETFLQKMHEIS